MLFKRRKKKPTPPNRLVKFEAPERGCENCPQCGATALNLWSVWKKAFDSYWHYVECRRCGFHKAGSFSDNAIGQWSAYALQHKRQ